MSKPYFDVTIITPTIPRRSSFLADNIRSVAEQTVPVRDHLIAVDYHGYGPGRMRNLISNSAMSEWLVFLDDDDILLPEYVERMSAEADRDVAIIYSYPRMGSIDSDVVMDSLFDPETLAFRNRLPVTYFIRTAAFRTVGGFPNERFEDWGLNRNIWRAGGTAFCIPEPLWVYRQVDPEARNVRE